MDLSLFAQEYNRDAFRQIEPDGKLFKMWSNEHCARLYQLASFEAYSVQMVEAMAAKLACFVDVGAHHGYYSMLVGSLASNCKIVAFEAAAENYITLKQNLDENQLSAASTYSCAISDLETTRDFCISTASDNCGFIAHPATPTQKIVRVQAYPLDNFRQEMPKGPTLIKIDTEGHEIEVLNGMQQIIQNTPDLKLLVEFNPKLLKLASHDPNEMLTRLDELGFDLYLLSDADGLFFHLSSNAHWQDYMEQNATANLLCLKKRPRLDLLFFSHSARLDGAERSLLERIKYFIKSGNMCTVVFPADGPMIKLVKDVGAAVLIREFYWWGNFEYLNPDEQARRLDVSFRWLLEEQPLLKKINPDVVFTNTTVIPWGALAAQALGKPHIWSITESGEAVGITYAIPFADVLQIIEDSSNFIISNSQAIQKTLFPRLSPQGIETIYPSVEIRVEDLDKPTDPIFSDGVLRLILIGTLIPVKGHLDAIMAMRELVINQSKKDVELLLIGSIGLQSYYDEIMEVINQHNLQKYIRILNFKENIFNALQQADILLMCSRMEAFGRITLEAMLLGKPVIGANRGGTPELVQDNVTGFLYEPDDYQSLAKKISYLQDHPEKRDEFGQNGKNYADTKFTAKATLERVVQIALALKGQKNRSSNTTNNFAIHLFKNTIGIQQAQANQQQMQANEKENNFQAALVNMQKEKELLLDELHNKDHELKEIYRSKAWRYVQQYRRFKELLRKIIFKK